MRSKILPVAISLFTLSPATQALPIDWNGTVGFDTNIIENVKRTDEACTQSDESYCPGDDNDHARYQSYVLRLAPTIIVNDSATIKGEISTGAIRGGFMGDDSQAQSSFYSQSPSGEQQLAVNQFYAELYADTALFKVGKYAKNFGLGAVINDGSDTWDRFLSVYNGVEANFMLGKFSIAPFWAKIDSPANGTNQFQTGKYDSTETGIIANYDDKNQNFQFSVYYGVRDVETNNDLYGDDTGPAEITLIDVFVKKSWEKFSLGLEIPMMSGEAGQVFGTSEDVDVDSNAYIFQAAYKLNPRWELGLDAGMVKGEDGEDQFNAMYLHPNFKIAQLMFAYNYQAFQNNDQGNIFSSSVTNSTYAKLFANYSSDAWTWRLALIMATASETASNGDSFYNHEKNSISTASADQEDDLGMEVDVAFDYQWNPNILVTGYFAHWQVGDYYGFTNSGEGVETSDVTATGLKLSLEF
ncbi:MAG: hypothetical protein CME64_07065 [Halobacteriovoraceae bacterium]|nr:hypothetical protein [Halobacteriovoraceae bacterium]